MTSEHIPVPVSPFQLRLKDFCIWIETKFERRITRSAFALRMALAAAVFIAIVLVQKTWLAGARWPLWAVSGLLFAWAVFWVILQIVRRLHDLGRSGGLFWGIAVPYWVAWRISNVFHLADKASERWWVWILLAALCAWSIWLTLQLFLENSTEGTNRYTERGAAEVSSH
jgi:uncharacterized membrane protein YhaH (DUF805 family)